jgi:hypothetical protein
MAAARYILIAIMLLAPFGASAFSQFTAGRAPAAAFPDIDVPPVQLDVSPIQQSETTSCGEAAITMLYNHARPDNPMAEATVIEYGKSHRLYTPRAFPFTSPANMVTLAQSFAGPIVSGNVRSADEGLAVLSRRLAAGEPIIIDVTTRLGDLNSGAHFVVVTGLAIDAWTGSVRVSYSNPLDGELESAAWDGDDGIWNAWHNNGDPGGSGWWLVISSAPVRFEP